MSTKTMTAKQADLGSSTKSKEGDFGRFDFVRLAPLMGGISLLAMVISVVLLMTRGLNYGIDFAGGTEVQVKFDSAIQTDALRAFVEKEAGLKNATVQEFGTENEFLIRMDSVKAESEKESTKILTSTIESLKSGLKTKFGISDQNIRRVDTVGPQVGAELMRNGILAAFYSFLVILIYVAIRFDYKYAPGAVVCLIHDVIFTLGIFSLIGREFNVQIMAAVLTLIGYSLNDTIVNYDRIRETYPTYREKGMIFIINKAVNDMLSRTILTASATMMAVLALLFFGGGVISEIAFTLAIGIVIGTYSSIYVAAPLILLMDYFKSPAKKTA